MLYCQDLSTSHRLTLDSYQTRARQSDQSHHTGQEGLRIPLLGLFGEVGSLLTLPKRQQREKAMLAKYEDSLIEEFGDVLWYLANLASRHRVHLSSLATVRQTAIGEVGPLRANHKATFSALQNRFAPRLAERRGRFKEADYFALGGAVGKLMSDFAAAEHWTLDRASFLFHLAVTLRLLFRAASRAQIKLAHAAQNNLAKIESRWPANKSAFHPLFDRHDDPDEQIPRRIIMQFVEKRIGNRSYVVQRCNGINIGDRLTDNKGREDDYRFHDVFHLAYAAILGWSPVIRALFRVKRKSDPAVDENQDGARAIIIEEGVATWIFNHGLDNKNFFHTKRIDYSLLKAVRHLVSGYEVEACPLWQWERAILDGFSVFRALKMHRAGWVVADLNKRSISFRSTRPRL